MRRFACAAALLAPSLASAQSTFSASRLFIGCDLYVCAASAVTEVYARGAIYELEAAGPRTLRAARSVSPLLVATPEPATLALTLGGLAVFGGGARTQRRAA